MNKTEFSILSRAVRQIDDSELKQAIIDSAVSAAVEKLRNHFRWAAGFSPLVEATLISYNDHRKYSTISISNCHGEANGLSEVERCDISDKAEKLCSSLMLALGIRFFCTRVS